MGGSFVKTFVIFVLGLLIGISGAGLGGVILAPKFATYTQTSPVGVEETVERLKAVAVADGWKVLGERKLHDSVKKHTGKVVRAVHLVDLCEPHHAGRILEGDRSRTVSVFMPCTVSVHQNADGQTQVTATNAKLLGWLFGGIVKEVMGGPVAEAQAKFVDAACAPKP